METLIIIIFGLIILVQMNTKIDLKRMLKWEKDISEAKSQLINTKNVLISDLKAILAEKETNNNV